MKKYTLIILIAFVVASCFQQNIPLNQGQEIPLTFMKSSSIDVAVATCRVTADDMDTIQVALAVSPTEISGNIPQVPYGDARLFEIFCYSSAGTMNYYGSVEADINSMAPVIDIVLYPYNNEANVSIRGTFGDPDKNGEKIVFVADWDGDYDVYMMNPNGSDLEQISFSDYPASVPVLSPDRKQVVYHHPSELGYQGFIINLETGEETMVPLQEYSPHQLSWHPTENKMIFWSIIHGIADVFEYDMDNDSVTCLIQDSSRIWAARYTPDGEHILYHSEKNGVFKAFIANRDGSQQTQLIDNPNTEERTIRMHPTNENLFLFAGRGFNQDCYSQWGLFYYDMLEDSVHHVISTQAVDESRPIWSPDGNYILYERRDRNGIGLYMIKPDGSENSLLLDPSGNEKFPYWF